MVLRVNAVVLVNVSGEKREEESLWSFHQQTRNHNKWQRHTPGSWQTPEEELRNVFQWFRNRTWNVCFDSAHVTQENYWEHRKNKSNSSLISWTLNSTQSCLRELTQNLEDLTFLPGLDSVFWKSYYQNFAQTLTLTLTYSPSQIFWPWKPNNNVVPDGGPKLISRRFNQITPPNRWFGPFICRWSTSRRRHYTWSTEEEEEAKRQEWREGWILCLISEQGGCSTHSACVSVCVWDTYFRKGFCSLNIKVRLWPLWSSDGRVTLTVTVQNCCLERILLFIWCLSTDRPRTQPWML